MYLIFLGFRYKFSLRIVMFHLFVWRIKFNHQLYFFYIIKYQFAVAYVVYRV